MVRYLHVYTLRANFRPICKVYRQRDMDMDKKEIAQEERRKFLKKAGAVAATAPAAALLLSANAKPAQAAIYLGPPLPEDDD